MSVELIVAASIALIFVMLTFAVCVALVMRQVASRPRPMQEQVAELKTDFQALEIRVSELHAALQRSLQREAKAERRAAKAKKGTNGEVAPEEQEPEDEEIVPPRVVNPAGASPVPQHPGPPHLLFQRRAGS